MIAALRKAGASPTAPDRDGVTPLERARYMYGDASEVMTKALEPEWSADVERRVAKEKADAAETSKIPNPIDLRKGCEAATPNGLRTFDYGLVRSPDGRRRAFTRSVEAPDGGSAHVLLHDRKDGVTRAVHDDCSAKWLPGVVSLSTTTLIVHDHATGQIVAIDAAAGRVLGRRKAGPPAASPDKFHVAYMAETAGGMGLFVMTAEATGARKVAELPETGYPFPVAWSGDGSRLTYKGGSSRWLDECLAVSPDRRGSCVAVLEIDLVDAKGGKVRPWSRFDLEGGKRWIGGIVVQ